MLDTTWPSIATAEPSTEASLLIQRAARLVLSLRAHGTAIAHAPNFEERAAAVARAQDDVDRLERTACRYQRAHAADLLEELEAFSAALPCPSSFVEASATLLAVSLAARAQHACVDDPELAGDLSEDTENFLAARAALREVAHEAELHGLLAKWASVAANSLSSEARLLFLEQMTRECAHLGVTCALSSATLAA